MRLANEALHEPAAHARSADVARGRDGAARLRADNVFLNYPAWDGGAPFGGYKQSGGGREYGEWALGEFLETKAVVGRPS